MLYRFKSTGYLVALFALALVFTATSGSVTAMERGVSPNGFAYASGGISETEQTELQDMKGDYNFQLLTAAKRSGYYLAGVTVRITAAKSKQLVLEHQMAGPKLLVKLPQGRFDLSASYQEGPNANTQNLKKTFSVPAGSGKRQMVLYFESVDQ